MRHNRGISFGTLVMLAVTVLALGGFFVVAGKLSGSGIDLTHERISALKLDTGEREEAGEILLTDEKRGGSGNPGTAPGSSGRTASAETENPNPAGSRGMTLTFGGTVAIEENIRKSAYSSDSRKYDFSLVMNLLQPVFQGDGGAVFLENLLMENTKVSNTVAPAEAAEMLDEAHVTVAAAGFSKAWEKEMTGITATRQALSRYGVTPAGIRGAESDEARVMIRKDEMCVALMEYTGNLGSSTRKAMEKKDAGYAIPEADADRIAADIQEARSQGAQAVVVMLNWGKVGAKSPEKTQRALAWQIAEAGADLIIGAGSRIPQAPEWLTVTGSDGKSRQVLCAYSLGTLISDNRKQINRMSSYALKVTFQEADSGVRISDLAYVPTYLWRYRQDGVYYYRCLAANRTPPDGMDSDQQQNMARAAEQIAETLKDSGIRVVEQN